MRLTVTRQPNYEIYEYGCHEGNNAMRNALSAERAYEKAVAEAIAKGLPPPPARVRTGERARPRPLTRRRSGRVVRRARHPMLHARYTAATPAAIPDL